MPPKKPLYPYQTLLDTVLLSDLSIDETGVYIAGFEYDAGPRLWVVGREDLTARPLIPEEGPAVSLVRVDSSGVFVVTAGAILRVDRVSGALTTVVETPPARTQSLTLDGDWVYGTTVGEAGGVFRAPKAGGALEWLCRGRASTVTASQGRVAYLAAGRLVVQLPGGDPIPYDDIKNPCNLHFFGKNLVWTAREAAGGLSAIDLDTGVRRDLTRAAHPSQLTSAGRHLYWTHALTKPAEAWIWRMDPDDPSSVLPLVKGRSKGGRLATGAGALVWIDDCGGGAHRMELTGLEGAA